jgi:type I restriction enzyme S subunit
MIYTVEDLFLRIRNGMNIKQEMDAGGLPITRIETIANAEINLERVGYAGLSMEQARNYLLEDSEILFSHINSVSHIGKCALYTKDMGELVHGMNLLSFKPNQTLLFPKYALYALRSQQFKDQLAKSIKKAVNQASVSIGDIKNITLNVPPLAQQQRIAAILDKAAEIKSKREQAIAKLDELANELLIEIMNNEEFNKFPTVKLGDVLDLQRGASPRPISAWMANADDGVNWIKISDATASDKYIFSCKEKIKPEAVRHSRFVKSGDFLLSNSMSFGRPYILRTDGCIHDGWLLLRDVNNLFNQDYLYSILCSSVVLQQFQKLATGAVVKNLNIDAVSKVEIKLLSIEAQEKFSSKVSVIEEQKSNHKKSLQLLNLQLASLQHQAFTTGFNA